MPHERTLDSLPSPPAVADAPRRSRSWPSLRQAWFQVHWFVGITAGSVLMLIGLAGATLAFREEIVDALNPGVRHVASRDEPMLTPQAIVDALRASKPDERVTNLTLSSEPGAAPRAVLAPPPGQRRGEAVYVDPYTGAVQPTLKGDAFFEWVEMFHRFLLLPRETGRPIAGSIAACLMVMALSGLYLRWPRRIADWRAWFVIDPSKKGRPFLWALQSVIGTFALVCYLVSTSSGIYWAFDAVRQPIDHWLGFSARAERAAAKAPAKGQQKGESKGESKGDRGEKVEGRGRAAGEGAEQSATTALDLGPAWTSFTQRATGWTLAQVRVPERAARSVQFSWLAPDAPHERARSTMTIRTDTGEVVADERYATLGAGQRFQAAIYPLHMGTYWGLPGRIAMMLAALCLPLFGITGWMMYLGRRHVKAEAALERRHLRALGGESPAAATVRDQRDPVLVAFASQTGHAERLALQAAGLLQRAGLAVAVQSLATATPALLRAHSRVLIVAASFGVGDPPDGVRRFARLLAEESNRLAGLRYGLLALGDRAYADFCGFGHALDDRLKTLGARPLFPVIEVDDGDAKALADWTARVGALAGIALDPREQTAAFDSARPAEPYRIWALARRTLLNEGSVGAPLYEVSLIHDDILDPVTYDDFAIPAGLWSAGMLVEVLPCHPQATVDALLARHSFDRETSVDFGGMKATFADALAASELPEDSHHVAPSAQGVVDGLRPLVPRRYSIASLPEDGALQLIVRQERHPWGLGLASGWLTAHAPAAAPVELRFVENPSFEPATDDVPCLFIGNGSGYAGLRAHLRARVRAGRRRNWLIFGERQRAHDRIGGAELDRWVDGGWLQRVDLAFSRDGGDRKYVQDHLHDAAIEVRTWIDEGAVVFVCGSLEGMATGVDEVLGEILGTERLEALIADGRYRRDVY